MNPEKSLDLLVEMVTVETEFEALCIANDVLDRHDFPPAEGIERRFREAAETLAENVREGLKGEE